MLQPATPWLTACTSVARSGCSHETMVKHCPALPHAMPFWPLRQCQTCLRHPPAVPAESSGAQQARARGSRSLTISPRAPSAPGLSLRSGPHQQPPCCPCGGCPLAARSPDQGPAAPACLFWPPPAPALDPGSCPPSAQQTRLGNLRIENHSLCTLLMCALCETRSPTADEQASLMAGMPRLEGSQAGSTASPEHCEP